MGFNDRFRDLILRTRRGHMGIDEFNGANMDVWDSSIPHDMNEIDDPYYPTRCELDVLNDNNCRKIAESIEGPVTLVSRGPGTTFASKDAQIAKYLDVVKVIYVDVSASALEQSKSECLFPTAQHEVILGDMFDPTLQYEIAKDSTEVNTMFGLTQANIEVDPQTGDSKKFYQDKSRALFNQLTPNAHLITTIDTNEDGKAIEDSYRGQEEFVLRMLTRNQLSLPVKYDVRFNKKTHILEHHLVFFEDTIITDSNGSPTLVPKGTSYHYNSSAKLPLHKKLAWEREVGFELKAPKDMIQFDRSGNIALLHFCKAVS